MSFPRYPTYKDSGVEWLGEVPEHWEVLPCRAIVDERTEKNETAACQDYLSLMANIGIIPYEEKGDVGNKKPEDLSKCKIARKGDFVINSMNYGIGSYGVSGYDGVCSPVYIVLTPRQGAIEEGFAFRIFEDKQFQGFSQSFGNGILAHRCAIGWDILKGIGVAVPPRPEQRSILKFLDRETAKIDALIAEQRRLIELLQEKRQAVISQAVTKGLNPDAPMKDSGVEWLGEVPEHWEALPMKRLLLKIEQGWSPECLAKPADDDEWGVVKAGCVNRGIFSPNENKTLPSDLNAPGEYEIHAGDLLMSRASGSPELIGSVAFIDQIRPKLLLSDKIFRLRTNEKVGRRYLAAVLASTPLRQQIRQSISGAVGLANNLPQSEIKNFVVALPPRDEQALIEAFITSESKKLDDLLQDTEKTIELLRERRSALISAAVTGQIDVRGLVPEANAA